MAGFAHDEAEADRSVRVRVDGVQSVVSLDPSGASLQHNGGRGRCLHFVSFEGDHPLDDVFGRIWSNQLSQLETTSCTCNLIR